jgi:hypothetical protein
MKVQIFTGYDATDQQNEINKWFAENNVIVHNITQSTGSVTSTIWTTISIFYTEVENINFEKVK